jgi:TP901 family phage tail tape measure protein
VVADNLGTARGSIEINTSDLKNADIALRSAGDSMLNFGMQAVGAFAAIVSETAKFEKEMDFVQAVTNATEDDMVRLKDAAIDLGKNSIFGPVALAEAFVELAKAGAPVEDIINGVGKASVELATAADVEIPFAGEGLINTLNTFKLEADDAARVANLLAGGANASSIELQDMFVTLKYAGPVAQGLGIEIEDLNAALSLLGKVGIRGSTAGTSLRQIMLNLSPPTERAANRMRELGILTEDGANQFFDAEGNVKSLSEVFGILGEATKDLNNEQKTAALRDLFGVRAIPSALQLLSQGEEGFAAITAEIERTTAADVAAKRMDNLDGSLKRLKATLQAVFVEAGGPFQQFLKGLVDGLREVILFFDRLPAPLKIFLVGAIGVIGVLSILAGAFLLTIGNIVRAVRVVGEIRNAFSLFTGAAKTATAANSALGASFLLNPMFLLAVAIVAVIAALVALYFHFKPFRDFIDGLWQDIQRIWDQILNFFKGLPENFRKAWQAVKDEFNKAKETIEETAKAIYGEIKEQIGKAIDFLKGLPGEIAGFLATLPGLAKEAVGELLQVLRRFLFDTLPRIIGFAIGFVLGLWARFYKTLITTWLNTWKRIISTVVEWGPKLVTQFVKVAINMVTGFISFVASLPGRIANILLEILTRIIEWAPLVLSTIWDIATGIVTTMWDILWSLPGIVWDILMDVLGFLINFVPEALSAAGNIGSSIWDGITGVITGIPDFLGNILNQVISRLSNLKDNVFNAAKEFAGGMWDGFKSGLGINSPSYIEEALFAIDDQVQASTGNLAGQIRKMQGLTRGIPTLNSGAVGLPSPAQTAIESGGGAGVYNQNAPLIGQATIRSDQDIVALARELDRLKGKQQRARGQRVSTS